jgi:hypothetical protein
MEPYDNPTQGADLNVAEAHGAPTDQGDHEEHPEGDQAAGHRLHSRMDAKAQRTHNGKHDRGVDNTVRCSPGAQIVDRDERQTRQISEAEPNPIEVWRPLEGRVRTRHESRNGESKHEGHPCATQMRADHKPS